MKKKRPAFEEAIRKGRKNSITRDVYARLVEMSWKKLLIVTGIAFFLINFIFAGLFLIDEGAIVGVSQPSLFDAFAMSVQTFSTIGYGALSPGTPFGHILVTIEAFVGIVWVALVTGLVFAKASLPRSGFVFSDRMVVSETHRGWCLCFRVGNIDGHDVVSAKVKLTGLFERQYPDGRRFRELSDLKLLRDETPAFSMTWTVMHPLDEDSELASLLSGQVPDTLLMLITTIEGHDKSYANTVHDRHVYYPDDIKLGVRFADVITVQENGQTIIDFDAFHVLEPTTQEHRSEDTN